MRVIVDTNSAEDDLHNALSQLLPRITRARLDYGDINIMTADGVEFAIERKASLNDFVAGFHDGRYHEQKSRLMYSGE